MMPPLFGRRGRLSIVKTLSGSAGSLVTVSDGEGDPFVGELADFVDMDGEAAAEE